MPRTISGRMRLVELRQREEELAPAGSATGFTGGDFPELRG